MSEKTYVVIGASSGIGFETAISLSGNFVIMGSRDITHNEKVRAIKGHYLMMNVDIESENSVKEFFSEIKKDVQGIDGLINCAGYVKPEGVIETGLENWNKTIAVNLTGIFLSVKYAFPLMKNGGRIVNISSTCGINPKAGLCAYSAAKSGLIGLSAVMAEELRIYGIRVFTICPGRTATPLRKILAPIEDPNTIMQPDKVSEIILYCLSGRADVLEGQPILVRERF